MFHTVIYNKNEYMKNRNFFTAIFDLQNFVKLH